MSLKFSPGNHSYWLDGKRVPGVTTIIGKTLPKPALTTPPCVAPTSGRSPGGARRTTREWLNSVADTVQGKR